MAYLRAILEREIIPVFQELTEKHVARASDQPPSTPQDLRGLLVKLGIALTEGQANAQNLFLHITHDEVARDSRADECRKMARACSATQRSVLRMIVITIAMAARDFINEEHPEAARCFDQDFKVLLEDFAEGLALVDLDLSFLP